MEIKYSFKDWCVNNNLQFWLDLWDYKSNNKNPEEVSYRSNKKYYFKCSRCIHDSELKNLSNITRNTNSKNLFCIKCRSFGQWLIDEFGTNSINRYWSEKNIIDPFCVSKESEQKVWIKCDNTNHPDYVCSIRHFFRGNRCPICSNKLIVYGINSIYDTHPHLVHLFVNQDDAKKYSIGSGKKALFVCPDCGNIQDGIIGDTLKKPFSCNRCSDGISYPEKFIYCLLNQVIQNPNITIQREKTFSWSKSVIFENANLSGKKKYDFYIDTVDPIIIETHGEQHFKQSFFYQTKICRTLQEEQDNDILKRDLAIANGIHPDRYIQLDCRKSNVKWIKNSIFNSNLPMLLNFSDSDINWDKCDKFASANVIKRACDIWNSGVHNLKDIGSVIGYSVSAVSNYLIKGNLFGWCQYDPCTYNKKPIICTDNNYIFSYSKTCSELSERIFGVFMTASSIRAAASGEHKTSFGFHFQYITRKEYEECKKQEPWRVFS